MIYTTTTPKKKNNTQPKQKPISKPTPSSIPTDPNHPYHSISKIQIWDVKKTHEI